MIKIAESLNGYVPIYSLNDPNTGEARYVGQTIKPAKERFGMHMYLARTGRQSHLYNWIRSVGTPELVVLEENPDDLDEAEVRWIAELRAQGNRLTNLKGGGAHGAQSAETRAKISATMAGKAARPAGWHHTPESRAKIRANGKCSEGCTCGRHKC